MSTENRVVRPYRGVDDVQSVLDEVRMQFCDRLLEDGQMATATTLQYLTEPLSLILANSEDELVEWAERFGEAVESAGLDSNQVEVVLVLASPRLKIADVVWRRSVKDLESAEPKEVVASSFDRPRALRAPFGGCDGQLYAVLADELEPRPLRPSRRGTWLARTTFKISTNLRDIGFTPLELTDEVRREHGLHEATVQFFLVDDPVDPAGREDALTVYVDTDVLARLVANPNTKGARQYQRQLFLQAMAAVVREASRELNDDGTEYLDAEGSLVHRLVKGLSSGGGKVDEDLAQQYWRDIKDAPEGVVANLESLLPDFKAGLLESLGEDE